MDKLYEIAHEKVVPVSMVIELLTLCNESCKHCYIPEHTSKGLDISIIKDVLRQHRNMGGFNVTFTGGEIFLRDDLLEIIGEARKLYLRVFLMTNASLLDEKIARSLKELNIAEVSVSIYSMDENEHDWITGVKGSLKKTLIGLSNARKYHIPVMVKTPLMEKNRFAFDKVAQYCKENNFEFMTSPVIFAQSNGNKKTYKYKINPNDMGNIVKAISKFDKPNPNNKFMEACGALKYSWAIDCFGNIYPCNAFYYKLGNVMNDRLQDVWDSKRLKDIQNIMKTDLKACRTCELSKECSRCPGLAYLEDGNLEGCSTTAKEIASIAHDQGGRR